MVAKDLVVPARWAVLVGPRVRWWMVAAVLVVLLVPGIAPRSAYASWPLESGSTVLLGFGGSYEVTAGASSTHRGVDIAASASARVLAPLAGTVTFAGRIPAIGGGTCGAVTIATDQGSLTLLPLASVTAVRGDRLSPGEAIGALAAGGDASSRATHLHVGLRRDDLYVDPLSALAAPEQQSSARAEPHLGPAAQPAGQTAAVGAAGMRPAPGGASIPRVDAVRAAGSVSVAAHAPVAGEQLAGGVSIAGGQMAPIHGAAAPFAGVMALPGELGTVARAEARTSAADEAAARASSLAARFARWSTGAAQTAGQGAAGALVALGLLWPLWRRRRGEGSGELLVNGLGDDVAAAVGR